MGNSESALLQRMRAGGSDGDEALVELLEQLRRPLMAFLCREGATPDQAENLVHDSFLKARHGLREFRGDSSLSTWIYGIAWRALRDIQRRDSRWVHPEESSGDLDDGADAIVRLADAVAHAPSAEDEAELRRLQKCIAQRYPEYARDHAEQAEDLDMIVTHGWSTHDLAVFRGVDDAAIRKRLQRARAILREYLAPCAEHYSGRLL